MKSLSITTGSLWSLAGVIRNGGVSTCGLSLEFTVCTSEGLMEREVNKKRLNLVPLS